MAVQLHTPPVGKKPLNNATLNVVALGATRDGDRTNPSAVGSQSFSAGLRGGPSPRGQTVDQDHRKRYHSSRWTIPKVMTSRLVMIRLHPQRIVRRFNALACGLRPTIRRTHPRFLRHRRRNPRGSSVRCCRVNVLKPRKGCYYGPLCMTLYNVAGFRKDPYSAPICRREDHAAPHELTALHDLTSPSVVRFLP